MRVFVLILSISFLASCNKLADQSSDTDFYDGDPNSAPLEFTGKSNSESAIQNRIFDETDGSSWNLSGSCNSNFDVKITGTGISAPTYTTCLPNKTFSIDIFYDQSSGSPYLNDGLVELTVQQQQYEASTTILKSTSSDSIELISNADELQNMTTNDANKIFILTNDIDMAKEVGATNNFNPIGSGLPLKGKFYGAGFKISNLHLITTSSYTGLFGITEDFEVSNLKLENIYLESNSYIVGGLIAYDRNPKIKDVHITGTIKGAGKVGGLIGQSLGGEVIKSSFTGSSTSTSAEIGGLIGNTAQTDLLNSYADADIIGTDGVGGLIGYHTSGSPTDFSSNYSTGAVQGDNYVGGLIGLALTSNTNVTYENSFSASDVTVNGANGGSLFGTVVSAPLNNMYSINNPGTCSGCDNSQGSLVDTSVDPDYFYNPANSPINLWDFDSTWLIQNNNYPSSR